MRLFCRLIGIWVKTANSASLFLKAFNHYLREKPQLHHQFSPDSSRLIRDITTWSGYAGFINK